MARAWTQETALALGAEISNELPYNDYFEYYGPDFKLNISPSNMPNQNSYEYLDKIKCKLLENLRMIPHVPSVQMQSIPEDAMNVDEHESQQMDAEEETSADKRGGGQKARDKRISHDQDLSDSEGDASGKRKTNNDSYKSLINKKRADEKPNGVHSDTDNKQSNVDDKSKSDNEASIKTDDIKA